MILYTQIIRDSDLRPISSYESVKGFEKTHHKIIDSIKYTIDNTDRDTKLSYTATYTPDLILYFKRCDELIIVAIAESTMSKTSVSLYIERLYKRFAAMYGNISLSTTQYITFEEVIKEESKKCQLYGIEETQAILKETKEVCLKNYTSVIERGHRIDQLEQLGNRLQGISERFKKSSRKMHMDSIASQYVFYLSVGVIVFIILYFTIYR